MTGLRNVLVGALLSALLISFGTLKAQADETLRYQIKPISSTDRTNLEITLKFNAGSGDPVKIGLPTDSFGTPEIHRYITSFVAESGSSMDPGQTGLERIIRPAADGTVLLRYVLSYDPKVMDNYPYAPNTGANYFHVAGCQWLLHVGSDEQKRPIAVEIVGKPPGWQLYSTIARNAARFETVASYRDLNSTAIGGGDQSYSFSVKQKPVSVFVHGKFDITNKKIYSAVERIVRVERSWFADYEQPFYHVIVAPRSSVTAGYATENAFINFVRKEIPLKDFTLLLAHEMFHYWLPGKIKIEQDKGYLDLRYEWFSEGFTDYFAPRILLEAELISAQENAEQINKAILNVADNPHRSETYDDFAAAAKAGKFDGRYKKLSYHRGAIIAVNWDTKIRGERGNRDLSDFIRQLYLLAGKSNGKITEQAFFDFAAGYGIDAKGDFDRYITRGEMIRVDPDARVKNFKVKETDIYLFDPGYSQEQTSKTGTISGVVVNGPAYRAGLRDGMEFVKAENSNRFSNSWNARKPLVITVKVSGQDRTFEFFPHGKKEKLRLFHPES